MSRSTVLFLGATAVLAILAPFVASSAPDGLERVAIDLGFEARQTAAFPAPLPDYALPWLPGAWSGVAAALLGTALVGALAWGAGRALARPPL